jgi:putative zinc finger/helix-turn-helix YgiT family protein
MPTKKTRQPSARPFPWPCSNCYTLTVVPTVIDYTAKVKHDGTVHELRLPALEVPRCQTCGEVVITSAVDEGINDALRSHLRLLTPSQMRGSIEKLGLKQQQLAERLGVAPETISRWLNGALIQSRAMDNLLRLFFALPEVREALPGGSQDPQLGTEARLQAHEGSAPSVGNDCPPSIARRLQTCQYERAVKIYGEDGLYQESERVRARGSVFPIGEEE